MDLNNQVDANFIQANPSLIAQIISLPETEQSRQVQVDIIG